MKPKTIIFNLKFLEKNILVNKYLMLTFMILSCSLGLAKNVPLTVEMKNQTYVGTLDTEHGTFKIENITFNKLVLQTKQTSPAPWSCDQVNNFLKKSNQVPIPDSIYKTGQSLVQFELIELVSRSDEFLETLKRQTEKYGVAEPLVDSTIQVQSATVKPILDAASIFIMATSHGEAQDFLKRGFAYALENEKRNNEHGVWPNQLVVPSALVYCDIVNKKMNFEVSLDFTIENSQRVKDSALNLSQAMSMGRSMNEYVKAERTNIDSNDIIVLRARQLEKVMAKTMGNSSSIDNNLFINFWHAMFEFADGPYILTELRARDCIRNSSDTKPTVKRMQVTLTTAEGSN